MTKLLKKFRVKGFKYKINDIVKNYSKTRLYFQLLCIKLLIEITGIKKVNKLL